MRSHWYFRSGAIRRPVVVRIGRRGRARRNPLLQLFDFESYFAFVIHFVSPPFCFEFNVGLFTKTGLHRVNVGDPEFGLDISVTDLAGASCPRPLQVQRPKWLGRRSVTVRKRSERSAPPVLPLQVESVGLSSRFTTFMFSDHREQAKHRLVFRKSFRSHSHNPDRELCGRVRRRGRTFK